MEIIVNLSFRRHLLLITAARAVTMEEEETVATAPILITMEAAATPAMRGPNSSSRITVNMREIHYSFLILERERIMKDCLWRGDVRGEHWE